MRAAILSIGDELVLGQSVDRNSAWLSERLAGRGVVTVEHRTVPDERGTIAAAVRDLAARADVLLITGGLGPTEDDLTRPALGDVLAPGRPLVTDEAGARALCAWFAGRDRAVRASNLVQAQRPESMRLLPNPHGTAPGLAGEHEACAIFALPGPPREMRPMFATYVAPTVGGPCGLATESVHAYGLGESDAALRLGPLTGRDRRPLVGTTASAGIVTARIRAEVGGGEDADAGRARVEDVAARIERLWTPYAFGRGEATLAQSVGGLLRAAGATVASAESCTGGWLGKVLVDDAGASDYFAGGWVTYSNELKTSCLGVPAALLAAEGAVSAPVAAAMADGALRASGADWSLAVTGIAGPGGGVPGKPRGTVFVAVGHRDGPAAARVRRFRFRGEREQVRDRSVKSALQMLRFALIGAGDEPRLLWEAPAEEAGSETRGSEVRT